MGDYVEQRRTADDASQTATAARNAHARDGFNAQKSYNLRAAAAAGVPITAAGYLHLNMAEVARAAHLFLLARKIDPGDPQVTLTASFLDLLFAPFAGADIAASVTRLRNWIAPGDLYELVDRNRAIYEPARAQGADPDGALDYDHGPRGPAAWQPSLGAIIGSVLEVRLGESLARMVPRLVAATARERAAGGVVTAAELLSSHPLDWQVAQALTAGGAEVQSGTLQVRDLDAHYRKIHRVEWQGDRGGAWNAVRVLEPADANVEEVAAFLFGKPTDAYRIKRVGDYFIIPEALAVRSPVAQAHRAPGARAGLNAQALGVNAAAIETTEVERAMADDATAPAEVTFAGLQRAWTAIHEQLAGIVLIVRPLGLDAQLVGAIGRHAAHKLDLGTLRGHAAIVRAELFARQHALLARIAGELAVEPDRTTAIKLVYAAGLSHLPETGEAAFVEAKGAKREGVLAAIEAQLGAIDSRMQIARLALARSKGRIDASTLVFGGPPETRLKALRDRIPALRSDLLHGTATAEQIEGIARSLDALRVEAELISNIAQLGSAFEMFDELESTNWVLLSEAITADATKPSGNRIGRLETMRVALADMRGDLQTIHSQWLKVQQRVIELARVMAAGGDGEAGERAMALLSPQVELVEQRLRKVGSDAAVQQLLSDAYAMAKSAERRTKIVQIAGMIALTIASGGTAILAEGAAAGLGASALGTGLVGLAAETLTFTMLEARISGQPIASALASNAIGNLATFGALRGVNKALAMTVIGRTLAAAAAGERVALLSKLAARAGAMTASGIVAIGVQFAIAEVETLRAQGRSLSLDEAQELAVQGIAMMIGGAISHSLLGEAMQELKALGIRGGAFIQQRRLIGTLAEVVMRSGDPAAALELLQRTRAQLELEQAELAGLSSLSDEKLEAQGLSRAVVDAFAKRNAANRAAVSAATEGAIEAQLGLDTIVPGKVFAGEPAAVARVIDAYRARGYKVEGEADGRKLTSPDGHVLHVIERAPVRGDGERPVRTPYGDVWPGEVPAHVPPAVRAVFEQAAEIYQGLRGDGYQGASVGRIRWSQYLVEHGVPVEGMLHDGGAHPVYERSVPAPVIAPSDVAVPRDPALGSRSANTGKVTMATTLRAARELVARGTMLAGARLDGEVVVVPLADGTTWRIQLIAPQTTGDDHMAAVVHGEKGDRVWVSDTLTDDQVPRALGAVIGEALAAKGKGGARFGELDALFAHREQVASERAPEGPRSAKPEDVKAHAAAAARIESTARIDAEIDVLLGRLGIASDGPEVAALPADLAAKVRAHLAAHGGIGFRPEAVHASAPAARSAGPAPFGKSEVLPDAPAATRPYGEADRARVLELRVELATIKEIDERTAHRDQPGTNGGKDIAKGETRRREQHVKRARELMAELQLGGDSAYIRERLNELAEVFPGVERDLVPAMEQRVQRRDQAAAFHAEAEAFRTVRDQARVELTAKVKAMKPLTTRRLVVGDGFSGLADVATLGVQKTGEWIDPAELLVIGTPDTVARMAAGDPSFRWGQRPAVYDRPQDAHPAFSDAAGRGTGALMDVVEDPGDFSHVGELRDAMDLARKRLGIVAVHGEVQHVETTANREPGSPAWEVDESKYPVRARVVIDGEVRYVYSERTDLATGPGKPRVPNETILTPADRAKLRGEDGNGIMFSGEKLLEGRDVKGKRVLVLAFGPTGAWTAKAAVERGASRVDFAGGSGAEEGTGGDVSNEARQKGHVRRSDNKPNARGFEDDVASLDRLQDVADGSGNVHVTLDRVVRIVPAGEGARVTYAHGPGENAELYTVDYDVVATTMSFTNQESPADIGGEPTVKEVIDDTEMLPSEAQTPYVNDPSGRVRVLGYASGDSVNVSDEPRDDQTPTNAKILRTRREVTTRGSSVDSPNAAVVEGSGIEIRRENAKRGGRK